MEVEYIDTNALFEGDLILISETPKSETWKFVPLFKEGTNEEIRVWQVGFTSDHNLKIVHGILVTSKGENGQLITATHPIVENKSGRNYQQQALLEARKRYMDQYTAGFSCGGLPDRQLRNSQVLNSGQIWRGLPDRQLRKC